MSEILHSHSFNGKTAMNHEHRHGISGVTNEIHNLPGHVHHITGYITFNHGHEHYFSVSTGPALKVESGHIHYYQGMSAPSHEHIHFVHGYTAIYID